MTLSVDQAAEFDIQDVFDWYENERQGIGREFVAAIRHAIGIIRSNPFAYARVFRSARRHVMRRFPYGVYFTVEGDHIRVFAVFHTSRDPSIWKRRLN